MIFADKHDITIFEMDRNQKVRSALGLPSKLKAATAASITAMCNEMGEIMPQLRTPVLIFHDPEDAISPIAGPLRLIELATCPRQLISLPGGLHAPHFNKFHEVLAVCKRFFSTHLSTWKGEPQEKPELLEEPDEPEDFDGTGDEEQAMESSLAVGKVPLRLQRLRMERPAFERFPLPSHLNETMVLLIYFMILLAIASSPTLVATAYGPEAGGWVLTGFALYLQVVSLVVCVNYLRAILQTRRAIQQPLAPLNNISIGILIPMYNEDVDVVRAGLESINEQPQAPNITVIIGLEARVGKESNALRATAVRSILTRVKDVYVFEHPADVPGDIKGCGSNQAWAMNQFLQQVDEDVSDWLFMKLDAQVVIQPGLLTELEHRMVDWSRNRRPVVWQPKVLHTINSQTAFAVGSLFAQTVEFFVIGIYGQPLISMFLFGQYAMPMEQYVRAGMHHPGVMAEDQAITIQCSWTNRSLTVQPLKHCVTKAPPLGSSLREAIEETLAQDTRFFVGSVLILPWNLMHNPSSLSALSFLVNSLLLRHFTTVAMPIMTFQSMFTIGYGLVRLPIERLEEALNGMIALFNLAGPSITVLMALAFALLQHCMIAQWPGRASQLSFCANINRILWMPTLQLLVFLTEVRASTLCLFYGSDGQHGPLQYRARKKIGAGQKIKGSPFAADNELSITRAPSSSSQSTVRSADSMRVDTF